MQGAENAWQAEQHSRQTRSCLLMPTTGAWAGMVARARRIHLQFTSIVALALNTRFFGLRTYAFFSFLAAVGWSMLKRTALSRLPGLAAKSAWRARAQVKNRQRA